MPRKSKDTISITWDVGDILSQAEQDHVTLTKQQAREVLHKLARWHDASVGINWGLISATIKEHVSKK